jgi:hypothetical protein
MQYRKIISQAIGAVALFGSLAVSAYGQSGCTTVPPINPNGTFLSNFLNSCYAYSFPAGFSTGAEAADLTETYAGLFYYVNSGYEVILIGDFPQSRYLNVAADDSHLYTQVSFHDSELTPLSSSYTNPFLPGATYQPNQLYAVAIQFGGTQPANIQAGCGYPAGMNFYANVVDGTKRHPGVSWNGSPLVYPGFPAHDDVGPNIGGMITVRQYLNETSSSGYGSLATPVAIVRDLSTGCAVPLTNAVANDPTNVLPSQVITRNSTIAQNWLTLEQIWAHKAFRAMKPTYCYTLNTAATAQWFRPDIYIPNPNPDAGYLIANIAPTALNWVITNPGFMRLRFQLPTTADIPCTGCSLTGNEQMRYFDISFADNQGNTLATIGSPNMVTDPNGNVTLIVGFGSAPPSWVTAANYYTYLDLSKVTGYTNFLNIGLRTVLPASTFACSASAVNYKTSEGNSLGGFMGQYVPLVDVLQGQNIPLVATPPSVAQSCGLVPPETPYVCVAGVYP